MVQSFGEEIEPIVDYVLIDGFLYRYSAEETAVRSAFYWPIVDGV